MRTFPILFALVLLAANVGAQNVEDRALEERLGTVSQMLSDGRTGEAERLLRQLIPKPEEERSDGVGIFSQSGVHDVLWALTGYSYLGGNDYANAERLVGERLRAVEARGAPAAGHLPIFLSAMAEIYRLQGKYDSAFPLYARLNQLWFEEKLPADFENSTEFGFVECLMVRGEAAAAEMASSPPTDPDGSAVGPSFHEGIFNTHAVLMEEAGHKTEAAQFEAKIDAESRRPPAANQQDRDLLRARLLGARKQDAAAEAIYRKWTGYWTTPVLPNIPDAKESLQIRTIALIGYGHFLSVRGRTREAQDIRARLAAMGCRLGMCQ